MTIKRVNFTGRRRVARDRVSITIAEGQPRTFVAGIDLEGLDFPSDAAVYLEATCAGSNIIQRFGYGLTGKISEPQDRKLDRLDGENVFFTLKIVDIAERVGRILGIATQIRPQLVGRDQEPGRRGILPVEPSDLLGQQLWKLAFEQHSVCLLVNSAVPSLVDRIRTDPSLHALIYPEIVRQILRAAIAVNVDVDEEEESWAITWLRFGRQLHPTRQSPPKPEDQEDVDSWVEETVEAFCQTHSFKDRYLKLMIAEGENA